MPRSNGSRRALTEQDRALWAEYASTLRPLAGRGMAPAMPAAVPMPVPGRPISPPPRRTDAARTVVSIGEAPPGLDRSTWHRFQHGRMAAQWRLDLHGHTAQHAHRRLEQMILDAAAQGIRCVEVITGRGTGTQGGILRRELPFWINAPHLAPLILAASHAHAGNPGSVRLLIRRSRQGA